ncbi:MAG: hydrolase, partial [Candidatus Fimivivens sp.]
MKDRIEDNKTYMDMIQNALYATLTNTAALYTLYDDAGGLTVKNVEDMMIDLMVDRETARDY